MEDTVVEVAEKKKSGKGIVLTIIGVLVVALIGIGGYLYLTGPKTNVYLKIIDEFSSASLKALNIADTSDKKEVNYEASVSLKTSSANYKSIADVLNKIKVKAKIQSDFDSKKINGNLELFYNNASTIDGSLYINDNDMYLSIKSLYDKLLKLPADEDFSLDSIWKMANQNNHITIIKELTSIVKNNLKEEYFTSTDEKLNVLGKEVNVLKQTFTLNGNDLKEFTDAVKKDILSNETLLKALADTSDITVDELKSEIEQSEDNFTEESIFLSEIYINKKTREIEYAKVKMDSEMYEFVKSAENTYDIKYLETKVGSISANDDNLIIYINSETGNAEITIKENNVEVVITSGTTSINMVLKGNEKSGIATIKTVDKALDIDATVNITYSVKNIKSLDAINYSDYKNIDKLTDEEYNSIMTKIYGNKNLATMIQDIMGQYSSVPEF